MRRAALRLLAVGAWAFGCSSAPQPPANVDIGALLSPYQGLPADALETPSTGV